MVQQIVVRVVRHRKASPLPRVNPKITELANTIIFGMIPLSRTVFFCPISGIWWGYSFGALGLDVETPIDKVAADGGFPELLPRGKNGAR